MEHEVNVPFSVGSVRAALAEPDRVARCVPGLQLDSAEDAGAKPADGAAAKTEGRLRVRIGGSTITYRGSLTVTPRGEEFAVKGTGTEARGTGSVRLNLTVAPRRSKEGEGTRLVCTGTVKGDGRIKEFEQKVASAAGQRLLERFAKALGESIHEDPPQALDSPAAPAAEPSTAEPSGGIGEPGDNERVIPGIPGPDTTRESGPSKNSGSSKKSGPSKGSAKGPAKDSSKAEDSRSKDASDDSSKAEDAESKDASEPAGESSEDAGKDRPGVFEAEVPPPSLDPLQDEEAIEEAEAKAEAEAEAAHARRTMIGRSAEEVDHAPPRGRYAPIPLPEPIANSAALRWIGPAAAAVVAGAVVVGRALRRRR
ncbi:SRPBCC family protein [Streptomyces albidus (ex Kaewkla and Franco 2022)]|uniref:SRPBCC family protein n=1 Tax=Streptomyces albidus (ex Kaewkla and Franco 2022) TaxID=722709 RepID=UPI0015EF51A3|nr:SRPBCC family protein [Streptomyces albidus (ex Kaewkla and Franco 2022)]